MSHPGTDSLFLPLAELIANTQADELQVKNQLLTSRENYVADKTASILQSLEEQSKKMLHSMQKLNTILTQELALLSKPEQEIHTKEFNIALERLDQIKKSPEGITKDPTLLDSESWQKFLGLSEATVLWLYQIGRQHYEQQKLEEAQTLFHLLIMLNSLDCDHWIGLGFTQKSLSQPQQALDFFAMAILLNPENPISRYQSAKLYLELGQFEDALIELEVLSQIVEKEKLDFLKSDIEVLFTKARNRQSL